MNYQINEQSKNEFELIIDGERVGVYTRKSSAKRAYLRLTAQQPTEQVNESASVRATASNVRSGASTEAKPPASNTGGLERNTGGLERQDIKGLTPLKFQERLTSSTPVSQKTSQFVMVKGQLKEIPCRKGVGTSAHIDTLTLTLTHDVFIERKLNLNSKDEHASVMRDIIDLSDSISRSLHTIFGFGIYEQKNGLNGYKFSFSVGTEYANYGVVAFGGLNQGDSIMITLYGQGLTAAHDGWETRLYSFIKERAPFTKITRCDLAHDFINGEYTPSQALQDWINGGFTQRHTRPNSQCIGSDWNNEKFSTGQFTRTGKTFYVGSPSSSRLLRVYDKGCELGDNKSPWVRFELQLRNRDYIIPHEILLAAGEYLTGAYPICEALFTEHVNDIEKCERIKKSEEVTLRHVVFYASQAASPTVAALKKYGFDNDTIVKLLEGGKRKLPKRLLAFDKIDCSQSEAIYLHIQNRYDEVQKLLRIGHGYSSEIRKAFWEILDEERHINTMKRMNKQAATANSFNTLHHAASHDREHYN